MVHKPAPTLETGPRVFLRSARYRRLDARFIMYLRISKPNARFSEAKLDKMCTYLAIAHFRSKHLRFSTCVRTSVIFSSIAETFPSFFHCTGTSMIETQYWWNVGTVLVGLTEISHIIGRGRFQGSVMWMCDDLSSDIRSAISPKFYRLFSIQ